MPRMRTACGTCSRWNPGFNLGPVVPEPGGSSVKNRKPWERMSVDHVGDVATVIQQGGGKLTPPTADPGEPRKPKGSEN